MVTGDFIWEIGKWTTTMHGTRYGATPNFAEQSGRVPINGVEPGDIDPYELFNLNLNYELTDNSYLALTREQCRGRGSAEGQELLRDDRLPVLQYFQLTTATAARSGWSTRSTSAAGK